MPEFGYLLDTPAAAAQPETIFSVSKPDALHYAELALDTATGDVAIPIRLIFGEEAVAQRIRVRFRFFLGEWFLDTRQGVPYYRDILVKDPDLEVIKSIFRRVLLTTPGVQTVVNMAMTLDNATRTLEPTFEAVFFGGRIFRSQPGQFIVTTP